MIFAWYLTGRKVLMQPNRAVERFVVVGLPKGIRPTGRLAVSSEPSKFARIGRYAVVTTPSPG